MHRTRFCHWLLIFYGATEILLFSGLVFGWGSLVYVLKQEGYMSDVCHAEGHNHDDDNNNDNFTAKSILAKQAVDDFLAAEIRGEGNASSSDAAASNAAAASNWGPRAENGGRLDKQKNERLYFFTLCS